MYRGPSLPLNRKALGSEALLFFARFAHSAVLLLQVLSFFAFAFGVNVCMGFTTNRFRRSEEWDEGPVSGTVTGINCASRYPYVIYRGQKPLLLRNSSLLVPFPSRIQRKINNSPSPSQLTFGTHL